MAIYEHKEQKRKKIASKTHEMLLHHDLFLSLCKS